MPTSHKVIRTEKKLLRNELKRRSDQVRATRRRRGALEAPRSPWQSEGSVAVITQTSRRVSVCARALANVSRLRDVVGLLHVSDQCLICQVELQRGCVCVREEECVRARARMFPATQHIILPLMSGNMLFPEDSLGNTNTLSIPSSVSLCHTHARTHATFPFHLHHLPLIR